MRLRKRLLGLAAVVLAAGMLAGCGDDEESATTTSTTGEPADQQPTEVAVAARDYAFDLPATFQGGLVNFSYTNGGKEPHFASFARIAQGKTLDDVKAALTAPPSATPPPGPPPFEEVIGFATAEPGGTGRMTGNLPAGSYAVYCTIPSPDGTSHAAKGMIIPVTVTAGTDGELPASVGTVNATDFSFSPLPPMKAGKNVVRLSNKGKQLHEINVIELAPGKRIDDALAWFRQGESGPPPMRFHSGVAVRPGSDATTELDLKRGVSYAFVCAIPDFLGDFKPHVTKGMYTSPFTPS